MKIVSVIDWRMHPKIQLQWCSLNVFSGYSDIQKEGDYLYNSLLRGLGPGGLLCSHALGLLNGGSAIGPSDSTG
jgi:hypothetical protein